MEHEVDALRRPPHGRQVGDAALDHLDAVLEAVQVLAFASREIDTIVPDYLILPP
jgi:hypothetical protein